MIYTWSEWNALNEELTPEEISSVEEYVKKIFGISDMGIKFTVHFRDNINDPRNEKPITAAQLIGMFKRAIQKMGKKISSLPPGSEGVLKDMRSDINVPFVVEFDREKMEVKLILKTIMRKKNFLSSNEIIKF